jgi:hypothetical protein
VVPPLSASAPSPGSVATTSLAAALNPHSVGPRLYPWSSIGPFESWQFWLPNGWELPAMIVFRIGVKKVSLR